MTIKKFKSRQIEKVSEQLRLLSWAQGAIILTQYGFNFGVEPIGKFLVFVLWIMCQAMAFWLDGKVEK